MIDRLGGEDRLMLDASRAWPQDIGALAVLDGASLLDDDGRLRLAAVRGVIATRLHRVPRFRQVLHVPPRGRGGPFWSDAMAFDLRRHVREVRLEPHGEENELLRVVEELRAERFDPAQPLWTFTFITGLSGQQVALFVKIHHAIADGIAAMAIMSTFLDIAPEVVHHSPVPWHPRRGPSSSQLVADNLRRRVQELRCALVFLLRPGPMVAGIAAMVPAVRELFAEKPGDRTSIDRIVGQGRRLALVRTEHRTVRRIGRAVGASVNDVLLAATAAGLRGLFLHRGEPVEGVTVRIYVPVSLRRHLRGPQQGTNIAQMVVPLSLADSDPLERLRAIAAETARRKARPRPRLGAIFRGRLATRLLLKAVVAQRVNVSSASIPGPPRTVFLAGGRVREMFPVIPLLGNEPLAIGAITYADTFGIGIAADRDTFPDLEVLAESVRNELTILAAATGSSPRNDAVTARSS